MRQESEEHMDYGLWDKPWNVYNGHLKIRYSPADI